MAKHEPQICIVSFISGVSRELFLSVFRPNFGMFVTSFHSLKRLHLVVLVLRSGELVLHASCGRAQGRLLSRSLDVRVLPGSRGPFLLSFGHAGSTAAVEIVDLHAKRYDEPLLRPLGVGDDRSKLVIRYRIV